MFSPEALDQVGTIRRRLREYLGELDEEDGIRAHAMIAGSNSGAVDVRDLTWSDQVHSWIIVPAGVFVLLLLSLKDFWGCLNLVATMVLTYAFALGMTWLGLSWSAWRVRRELIGRCRTSCSCFWWPWGLITTSS